MPNLDDILTAIEQKTEHELSQFTQDVESEVQTLRLQGLSDDDILNRLVDEFQTNSGIFDDLASRIGTITDFGINVSANLSVNMTVVDASGAGLFAWMLEPSAEHCVTCEERDGQVKTYQEWDNEGLPGQFFRSGNIGTECGFYCRCVLIPA